MGLSTIWFVISSKKSAYRPFGVSRKNKTTTHGLGFKNKEKALYTIKTIKNRSIKYQVNVVATMLGRAKNHPNKTGEMEDAIEIFGNWMKKYKSKKNEN